MGRGQWPRQVLIWSLPAVAALISFLWFKRRRTALRIDPGGTSTTPPQRCSAELPDTNCKTNNTSIATADTKQVIAAFEKAVRDIETLRAIEEVVSVEEAEEERDVFVVETTTKEIAQEVTSSCESASDKFDEIETEKDIVPENFEGFTSTPLSDKSKNQEDIAALDSSIILVLANTNTDVLKISSDSEKLSTDDSSSIASLPEETEVVSGNQTSLINLPSVDKNKTLDVISDKSNSIVNSSVNHLNENIDNGSIILNENKANNINIKNLNNKLVNRKVGGYNNISNKTKDNKKMNVNSNTNKIEKDRLKGNRKNKAVVVNGNGVNEMELPCNRVEDLGRHISTSTSIGCNGKVESSPNQSPTVTNNSESGERDSANHSPAPADVQLMLASPSSMSNFSDAHSEGSSDSGKGCSDIPEISTPPAGGSSLSGDVDVTPAVFEFIIPQHMVGRLIGRYGGFLHDIRSKTHTHIFIKRHPETPKLKICAIEGTQQDIDTALELIRFKFPLRRFPNLTLEKVTFVNIASPMCPLAQEQFQLQLIEGVNNDVILCSLVTAGHFFLQQPMHPSYSSLCQLNAYMNNVYSSPEAPMLDTPLKDAVCAAPAIGGWYRAQIIHIDEDNKTVDVRFLDYGGFLTLETSALRKIRGDLMLLPFQAVECLLANVVPVSGDKESVWSEEARLFVQELTCAQMLQAQVTEYTEQGIPLVFLYAMYCGQVVMVNDELVSHGFAEAYLPKSDSMVTEE